MEIVLSQGGQPQTDPRPADPSLGLSSLFSPESLQDPHQGAQEQEISKAAKLLKDMFSGSLDKEALEQLLENLHQAKNKMNQSESNEPSQKEDQSAKHKIDEATSNARAIITAVEIADIIKAALSRNAQGLTFEEEQKLKDLVDYIAQGVEVSVQGSSFSDKRSWQKEEGRISNFYERDEEQPSLTHAA